MGPPTLASTGPAGGRPPKVAKETATLDQLSDGRLTLGVGLGSNRFAHELSATGEELNDRQRGQMLDESLQILTAAWTGKPVHHHSHHYTVNGIGAPPTFRTVDLIRSGLEWRMIGGGTA